MNDPFSYAVGKWVMKAGQRADAAYQATALDAVNRVKELTPVKTGYLRANWTAIKAGDTEPVAGQVPPAEDAISKLKLGETVVITNPVVYARRIEFGFVGVDSLGRHYDQPGRGMLQQTISELPAIAQSATARVISEE